MIRFYLRRGIAMIELVFAIVIIAIVMLSIPMMIRVMNQSQELSLGQEIFAKLYAQAQRKSMNPWDRGVSDVVRNPLDTNGTILWIPTGGDLNCTRLMGSTNYRDNNISERACNQAGWLASAIPNGGDANGTLGIEHYNNTNITIKDTLDGDYNARIMVAYVNDAVNDATSVHQSTTWALGSDTTPSGATAAANATHLKRVVMTFTKNGKPTSTFTFFMSNIGVVQ